MLLLGGDGYIGNSFISMQKGFSDISVVSRKQKNTSILEKIIDNPFAMDIEDFEGYDVVFNCLGLAHVNDKKNELLFYRVNTELPLFLATLAKKAGVKNFIQMSSISVYGATKNINTLTPENPITHYGKSKVLADMGLIGFENANFKVTIIRPPMIFGCGAPGNMMRLIKFIKANYILPFKNAVEKRDFLLVDNFVTQMEYIIQKSITGIQLLTDLRPLATIELVETIIRVLGKKKLLINFPYKNFIKYLIPNLHRKLFEELFIESTIDIPSYIKESLKDPIDGLKYMVLSLGE